MRNFYLINLENLVFRLFLVLGNILFAQQQGFNYKAIIKDNLGNVITNQSVTVQFKILEGNTTVYSETHNPITNANGLVVLSIGNGNTSDDFLAINWNSTNHSLNVQIDVGDGIVDLGTSPFQSVPYASNVSGIESLDEGNGIGWRIKGKNPDDYGNIGEYAVDLSQSLSGGLGYGATGLASFATGFETIASGDGSTAIGLGTRAESIFSTAIGRDNIGGGNPTEWVDTDPLLEVGNGIGSPSNALTILKNGTITAPSFDVSEITDDKALITKEYLDNNSGLEPLDEGNGIGWRIKGRDTNDYGNIGEYAVDLSQSLSSALDFGATGVASFTSGFETIASGQAATAMGRETRASGDFSTTLGDSTKAQAFQSTALGVNNVGGGNPTDWVGTDPLLEIGNGNGSPSNAVTILKNGDTGIGGNPNANLHVFHGINAGNDGLKIESTGANTNYWRIYTVNSTGNLNLFSKLNGNNTVGNFNNTTGAYSATSDRRLKKDFKPLPFSWEKFMNLETLSYLYKIQSGDKRSLGLIAQDVEVIYPELVTYNIDEDVYHLNYSGFGVVAIKAVQELKKELNILQNENKNLKAQLNEIQNLKEELNTLITEIKEHSRVKEN